MITHVSHRYADLNDLDALLCSERIREAAAAASAVLVQVFSADLRREHVLAIAACIADRLPAAVVVGATTVGEIAEGRMLTGSTVIGFTFFTTSSVAAIALPCHGGDEFARGADMGRRIAGLPDRIAGVLLLATPLSIDAAALLAGIESTAGACPVFGGGAGDYAAIAYSFVFSGGEVLPKGAVAVVFSGSDLHIESRSYLGWRPLSKPMRVTRTDGLFIQTVDDKPAFDVYRRYLNIPNDESFFLNALEFPFLFERDGECLARVPVATTEAGALQFVADIREGETFRIGYGDMDLIVEDAANLHRRMSDFSPEAIFLYSCGCRRFLMQDDVDLETLPFESIAPTFGFYTYGEFFASPSLRLLNSTMVAVGLREGALQLRPTPALPPGTSTRLLHIDPYANKHARVVGRLMRFIDAVTTELETSNRELLQHRQHLEGMVEERTAELTRAKEAAEAANIAKNAFLANVSHEMRTPLHQISGMASLLQREPLSPKQQDRVDKLEAACRNLGTIVETVLVLTSLEANKFRPPATPLDIGTFIAEALNEVSPQASAKSLHLRVEKALLPGDLHGELPLLKIALSSYLSNAVRFTKAGSITVRTRLLEDYRDHVLLRFEVEDTGIGVAPEDQKRLFNIFEQVDNSSTRQHGGLGTGLALTRKIARLMGGDAGCESKVGEGSLFWFSVQLRKPATPGS